MNGYTPKRRCLGCKTSHPKPSLIRIVNTADGIVVDPVHKLQSRAVYLCKNPDCFAKFQKTKALNRAFSKNVPQEIYDMIGKEVHGNNPKV